jgi:hypothetical protein
MEIYDDPEVFTCIDKIDDLVQEALHNGWKYKNYLI